MQNKLFVGSLPWSTTDEELAQLFSGAGQVVSATVIHDRATGRSKGFGFVEMGTDAEAQDAVEKYNGYDLNGRSIVVNVARPREERPNRDRRDRR